jgi:putative endonuclease
MHDRRRQGGEFEDLACAYLKGKGYKILDRNVYLVRKELDVVALHRGTVVFVEVKGRRSTRYGLPAEAMGRTKRRHIIEAARVYIKTRNLVDKPCRFDFVAVTFKSGLPHFRHIENAFQA